jgi:hypothetical protein
MTCVTWNVGQPGERVFVADGWGQRDWKNSDIGATLPYFVRRTVGDGTKTFVSVIEGYAGDPFVREVRFDSASGVLSVETAIGTDRIMCRPDAGTLTLGPSASAVAAPNLHGRFAVASIQSGKLAWSFVEPGDQ